MQALHDGTRRTLLRSFGLAGLTLAGCGGGGDGAAPAIEGARQSSAILSQITGTDYPLAIYTPPASAGPRDALPVIYALDGQSWFETLVSLAETTRTRVIIVAIFHAGQRNRDFVPANACTPLGGGHAAFHDFLRSELIPRIEATVGGDPARRVLFGHSHGGTFALYALFGEGTSRRSFGAYWASDSSISCMTSAVEGWEQAYASSGVRLPALLHLSYASAGNQASNAQFAAQLAARRHPELRTVSQEYSGSHNGIVPAVLADAIVSMLPPPR